MEFSLLACKNEFMEFFNCGKSFDIDFSLLDFYVNNVLT